MNIFQRLLKLSIQKHWKYRQGKKPVDTLFMSDLDAERRENKEKKPRRHVYFSHKDGY